MIFRWQLLLLIFILPRVLHAQVNLDSLKRELPLMPSDTNKVLAIYTIAATYVAMEETDSARKYVTMQREISQQIKYYRGIATAASLLGNIEWGLGNYKMALDHHFESLRYYDSTGSKRQSAGAYHNIGNIFMNMDDDSSAEVYFTKAVKLNKEIGNKKWLSYNYISLGSMLIDNKDPRAADYINEAMVLANELNDTMAIISCYINYGLHYMNLSQPDSARDNFRTGQWLSEITGYRTGAMSAYLGIGNSWFALGKHDSAEYYFLKSLGVSNDLNSLEGKKAAYKYLAQCDSAQGHFESAFSNYKRYIECRDSLISDENTRKSVQLQMQHEFDKKQSVMEAKAEEELQQQKLLRNGFIIGFALMIALAFFIFRGYRIKQKSNVAIAHQKEIIEEKNKEILDSIHYAQRIQKSLLASEALVRKYFPDIFILYKPKDIVSGDFYWCTEKADRFYFAVCDSTGHGVPGAFMSLLNISFMNEAIVERNLVAPGDILNHVRQRLMDSFLQEENRDGMDAILLCYDKSKRELTYAAAHNRPFWVSEGESESLPADKMPVGRSPHTMPFNTYNISLEKTGMLYLLTDGYADQFGGPKGKKFKAKNLYELLTAVSGEELNTQHSELNKSFEQWKGNLEQVDDVLVVGIRL